MADDGLFDADWQYVDVPASELSPTTRDAATAAAVACATS